MLLNAVKTKHPDLEAASLAFPMAWFLCDVSPTTTVSGSRLMDRASRSV